MPLRFRAARACQRYRGDSTLRFSSQLAHSFAYRDSRRRLDIARWPAHCRRAVAANRRRCRHCRSRYVPLHNRIHRASHRQPNSPHTAMVFYSSAKRPLLGPSVLASSVCIALPPLALLLRGADAGEPMSIHPIAPETNTLIPTTPTSAPADRIMLAQRIAASLAAHSTITRYPAERPKVSGAYISSARAGAAKKVPGVVARTE